MHHPELGMVSPTEFIPIAESSGLILNIGEWALRTAMNQLKEWVRAGFEFVTVSVNLSAAQLRQSGLAEIVKQSLEENGLKPKHLELELTESTAIENPLVATAVMDELHQHGIRMSIDDFGTGHSSLSHLKRFKAYKLKIDRSFVSDLPASIEDVAIVGAVIKLADKLGMQTIAEGVETEEQINFLRENGCMQIQGRYFSQPISAEQFESLLLGEKVNGYVQTSHAM